jgi:transposase
MLNSVTFHLGMDVHKDSVTVAVFRGAAREPETVERLPYDLKRLKRLLDRLAREGSLCACYEASGAGFVLQRQLTLWGYHCDLAAPSLIPQRPGEQRKHDRIDAIRLGQLYRSGELTLIHVPAEADEQVRDLVRCRETFQREILRSRHYVLKFLRRRGLVYRGKSNWTRKHREWLNTVASSATELSAEDRMVLAEYLALLDYKLGRRAALDHKIDEIAVSPRYRQIVGRLRCFRGIDTQSAMVIATELHDLRRFQNPQQLMAYVGLVPREHSSGERRSQGAITKAGNTHCRHVLVQAAWSYRNRPAVGEALRLRQQDQDAHVVAHTWKAQHRLFKLYHRIHSRRPAQIAAVAVARELIGFIWAVAQDDALHAA